MKIRIRSRGDLSRAAELRLLQVHCELLRQADDSPHEPSCVAFVHLQLLNQSVHVLVRQALGQRLGQRFQGAWELGASHVPKGSRKQSSKYLGDVWHELPLARVVRRRSRK